MNLRLGTSLLFVLGADALSLPTRQSAPISHQIPSFSRRTTKIAISASQGDIEPEDSSTVSNGQRFRSGLKRFLRKPENPPAERAYAPITVTATADQDDSDSSTVQLSSEEDLSITSVRLNASTNVNSAQISSIREAVKPVPEAVNEPEQVEEPIAPVMSTTGVSNESEKVEESVPAVMVSASAEVTKEPEKIEEPIPTFLASTTTSDEEAEASDNEQRSKGRIASFRKPKQPKNDLAITASLVLNAGGDAVLREDKRNKKILHIMGLMAGTLWWYIFSSYEFLTKPDVFDVFDIYSSGNAWLYNGMSAYVTISQLCTYFFLWKLMTTKSLREGQAWIGLCIFACVPADTIVILFDPTGEKALTVMAFTLVTLIYGVILAFYLREAAALEPNPTNNIYGENEAHGMLQEVIHYRPPAELQNTHMALDFARSFGAFTITVAAMKDQLFLGEVGMTYYAVLFVVVAHAALEMTLTTVTPGIDLCKFRTWIKFQTFMSLFEMFAATYIAHYAPEEDLSLWDDLVYSLLFGSAAAALQEFAAMWGEDTDWDSKLKMANQDISNQSPQLE